MFNRLPECAFTFSQTSLMASPILVLKFNLKWVIHAKHQSLHKSCACLWSWLVGFSVHHVCKTYYAEVSHAAVLIKKHGMIPFSLGRPGKPCSCGVM